MMRELYESAMGMVLSAAGVKHFSARELCRVGRTAEYNGRSFRLQPPPARIFRNILATVEVADWLRAEFGPLLVTSGYRDPDYNLAIGGEPHSLHLSFNALDLRSLDGAAPAAMAAYLESHRFARQMGIGVYAAENFVHVDTRGLLGRPAPARWPSAQKLARAA